MDAACPAAECQPSAGHLNSDRDCPSKEHQACHVECENANLTSELVDGNFHKQLARQIKNLDRKVQRQQAQILEQQVKLKEQQAELAWMKRAPGRMSCLLDARDNQIKRLQEVNSSLQGEIERMKHTT